MYAAFRMHSRSGGAFREDKAEGAPRCELAAVVGEHWFGGKELLKAEKVNVRVRFASETWEP